MIAEKKKLVSSAAGQNVVRPIRFVGKEEELLEALKNGHPGAPAALYDLYSEYVRCLLTRILGHSPDVMDLIQESFIQALASISRLDDANKVKAWVGTVAVNTARNWLRKKRRASWLRFSAPADLPARRAVTRDQEAAEVLRLTYEILDRMPVDERIPFTLRFIEGMELAQTAAVCKVSLATIKRRISKAEKRFLSLARHEEPVMSRIEAGSRWRDL